MAQQTIGLGTEPNDETGDNLRTGGDKINDNFTELYGVTATALQPLAGVVTATGTLTVATHSGQFVVTSGNVTIPHASGSKGFNCVLVAGGAHTVSFHDGTNPITSAAMAAGDMMTVFVQDDATGTPTIRLRLSPAAEQVELT